MLVDNLLPTIVGRWFCSYRYMRRAWDARKVLMCLEGWYFRSGLKNPLAYKVDEPNLENMVQFLGVDIKLYGEPRSSVTPLPIFSTSFTSSITTSTEKSHHVAIFNQS
jgi:hypothetical protein